MNQTPTTKLHLTIEYQQSLAEKPGEVYITPVAYLNGKPLAGEPIRYGPMSEKLIPAFKIQIEKMYRTNMRKTLDVIKAQVDE